MQPEQNQPPTNQWQFVPEQNQQAHVGVVSQAPAAAAPSTATTGAAEAPANDALVQWSASEFVDYQKNAGWYVAFLFGILVLGAIVFAVTRDFISTGSIILVGILFMTFAARKPRVLTYSIDESGIRIGDKLYGFDSLRSFAVIDEGKFHSISLLPLKRFMPPVSMYFEPQDESRIASALGSFLPKEDRNQDFVDRLMHRIRF